jgi:hypothetical protein
MALPGANGSFSGSLSSVELQNHVLRSYFLMRIGIAIIGIAFPFVLLFGGLIVHICPQDSMSAYYHAIGEGGASMRNWFVGLLFAVSISLGLYRGYSRVEDRLLDAAGFLGVGIAIFPMSWSPLVDSACGRAVGVPYRGVRIGPWPLHDILAFAFFICIAFVCWFCADDTLCLVPSPARRRQLRVVYRVIALLMPTTMFAAWGINTIWGTSWAVFWAEAAGVVVFGVYWLIKGLELRHTAADLDAAQGKLRQNEGEVERVQA